MRKTHPLDVVVDARSPAAHIVDKLTNAGWEPYVTGAADMARSSAAFYSAVSATDATVNIVRDDALTVAALGAVRRQISDVGYAWDRRDGSSLDITPLVAASLALGRVAHYEVPSETNSEDPSS